MDLTDDELAFLKAQELNPKDVFDWRGIPSRLRRAAIAQAGAELALGATCKNGHRLRTRSGHCVQCDTSKLAYQKRHRKNGYVYVAHSGSLQGVKVGFSTDDSAREGKINFDAYGGASDWNVVFRIRAAEGGRLEQETHVLLSRYRRDVEYNKDGSRQQARETFDCSPLRAVDAILDAIRSGNHAIKDHWIHPQLRSKK